MENIILINTDQIIECLSDLVVKTNEKSHSFAGISSQANKIQANNLFVAISGVTIDGHEFITEALQNRSAGLIVSRPDIYQAYSENEELVVLVKDSRRALSRLAALFSGYAADQLLIVGVTGTNGKTTTHWMIDSLLSSNGITTARFGTLGVSILGEEIETNLTTPDPVSLHKFFRKCVSSNVKAVVMEVSSHALDQFRVEDVPFFVGVFTNLSRDHLDYHKTMEYYALSKAHLFDLVVNKNNAVVNQTCEWSSYFSQTAIKSGCKVVDLGFNPGCRYLISDINATANSTVFKLTETDENKKTKTVSVTSPFIGDYNVENLVTAIAAVRCFGIDLETIVKNVGQIPQVPGRLERCNTLDNTFAFVDYAHTPDALSKALKALKPICQGKLKVVFGCGGDRDKGKRPLMLNAAMQYADQVMITSDNPRTENPLLIIEDILSQVQGSAVEDEIISVEPDRKIAIEKVLSCASSEDCILIAGKGHEDYQIIGDKKTKFSDQEIVKEFYQK